MKFKPCPIPADLAIHSQFRRIDYQDCYSRTVASETPPSVDLLARLFFSDAMPKWIQWLLSVRERIIARTGRAGDDWSRAVPGDPNPVAIGDRIGPWKVVDRTATEIVFREDEGHLDFAFSLRVRPDVATFSVEATTLVEFHGWPGRIYFLPVKPFHRRIVPVHMDSVLEKAMRIFAV